MPFEIGHAVVRKTAEQRKKWDVDHKAKLLAQIEFDRRSRGQRQRYAREWAMGLVNEALGEWQDQPLGGK